MRSVEEIKGRCVVTDDGHWLWKGALRPDGRPNIYAPDYRYGGEMRTQNGYRAVWNCLHQRAVPTGYRVFGICGEPTCCNPAHIRCASETDFGLWLRKQGLYKGKTARILANRAIGRARTVLTPEIVHHIQASTKKGYELADELGISKSTVSKVRRGEHTSFPPAGMFSGLLARPAMREGRAAR